jgi:hypothetical protein
VGVQLEEDEHRIHCDWIEVVGKMMNLELRWRMKRC